jgi:retron-type reverse transcriptase
MPEGPAPRIILSKKRLHATWSASRDASARPAAAGIDKQSAISFSQKLNENIVRIHDEIVNGNFHFSALKPIPIPKDNGKIRIICIPTVRDRLVQRAIVTWLVEKRRVPHQDFVYGVKGQGLGRAIKCAITIRSKLEWCVKTDIQSFFDNIQRDKLKSLIEKRLSKSSLIPLLYSAIDREVRSRNPAQILEAGIRTGIGIRQGMPLSPLLANFSLTKFDAACAKSGIKLLRYADDILAFFADKQKALDGLAHIKDALAELQLEVPELGSAKTEIIAARDPVTFLGREIVHLDSVGGYVSRVGDKKINAIKTSLTTEFSLKKFIDDGRTVQDAIGNLAGSLRSYLGTYKDAHNFERFNGEIRHHFKAITTGWFIDIFGARAINALSDNQKIFLGILQTEPLEPIDDVELSA